MKTKSLITVGLPILALFAVIGWRLHDKGQQTMKISAAKTAKQNTPPVVDAVAATPFVFDQNISAVGTVNAPETVKLSSTISGKILYLIAREGDAVKAGSTLVKIDPSDLTGLVYQNQANLAAAESNLAKARITQNSSEVGVSSAIAQQRAAISSAIADNRQQKQNYGAQVAVAESQVADAKSKVSASQSNLNGTIALLASSKANEADANAKLNRTTALYEQGFIAAQDVDDAKTALLVASNAVKVAESNVQSAQAGLNSAKAALNVAQKQADVVRVTGQSAIASSNARLTQANQQQRIVNANQSTNAAYLQNIAALEASVTAAQAQLDQSRAKLENTNLSSPIDGTVTERDADPGAVATPGQTLLVVQALSYVYVDAYIPIENASAIHEGQSATISIEGIANKPFTGTVAHVSPSSDPTTRQFLVRIKVSNDQKLLHPGMFGNVVIHVGKFSADVTVPKEAVTTDTSQHSQVTVLKPDGTSEIRDVQVGLSNDSLIQITSGLQAGEKVVTLTYGPLKDGQKAKVPSTSGNKK